MDDLPKLLGNRQTPDARRDWVEERLLPACGLGYARNSQPVEGQSLGGERFLDNETAPTALTSHRPPVRVPGRPHIRHVTPTSVTVGGRHFWGRAANLGGIYPAAVRQVIARNCPHCRQRRETKQAMAVA